MSRVLHVQAANRRGTVLILTAFMMIAFVLMLGMAIDMGYLLKARSELQRSADAAALAACWELVGESAMAGEMTTAFSNARSKGAAFAGLNQICRDSPLLDANVANAPSGDIVIGYVGDFGDAELSFDFTEPTRFNTVQVHVQRNTTRNGEVRLFFGNFFGVGSRPMEVRATAAVNRNLGGFRIPSGKTTLEILPFALDLDTWQDLMSGVGTDDYTYNAATGAVTSGPDGVLECNLYPQGTGSPGNRGTVDIGSSNNSTNDIARQIVDGVSAEDLEFLGGSVELNEDGELPLNGDTGISAGVKDELASIIGHPRIIPIFSAVSGPGNNATYTITHFAGVRIMYVKLTGSMKSKKVMIQPAPLVIYGGIPAGETETSWYISSPARLVR